MGVRRVCAEVRFLGSYPRSDGGRTQVRAGTSDSEFAEAPPLKLKRVAADVGLADEYANMTRLTAKLAHPSAYSVAASGEDPDIASLRPILFRAGAGHGLEILRAMKER